MLDRIKPLSVTVVICAYTSERWGMLLDVIESVRNQTLAPVLVGIAVRAVVNAHAVLLAQPR